MSSSMNTRTVHHAPPGSRGFAPLQDPNSPVAARRHRSGPMSSRDTRRYRRSTRRIRRSSRRSHRRVAAGRARSSVRWSRSRRSYVGTITLMVGAWSVIGGGRFGGCTATLVRHRRRSCMQPNTGEGTTGQPTRRKQGATGRKHRAMAGVAEEGSPALVRFGVCRRTKASGHASAPHVPCPTGGMWWIFMCRRR